MNQYTILEHNLELYISDDKLSFLPRILVQELKVTFQGSGTLLCKI